MRGKWSSGLEPRSFTWVFRDLLAVSERPGGNTGVHRKVRRDEELLWLHQHGFTRVISVLPSSQNLEGYAERGLSLSHYVLRGGPQQREVLEACYQDLSRCLTTKTVVLLHGLPGNEQNLDLAQAIRRAGWNVLTLHYRGAWGSPGQFSLQHVLEDADAAVAGADVAR